LQQNHAEESGKREWGDAAHLFLASSLPTNIANAANYDEHSNFPIPSEVDEPNQIESTPGASDLDRSAGSGFTETETDGVRIVEKCNKEDLDLVEGALLHMLGGKVKPRESNDGKPSRADQQPLVLLEDQDIPHAEMEMVLLAKLLDQVCSFSSWDNRQVLVCFLLQRLHVLVCQNQLFPSLICLLWSNTMRVYWTGVHTSGPQKLKVRDEWDSDKTFGTETL